MPNTIQLVKLGSLSLLALACLSACGAKETQQAQSTPAIVQAQSGISVSKALWGQAEGQNIYLFTIKNAQGMTVQVMNWGATAKSIWVPDRNGKLEDILIGYDSWDEYHSDCCYSGPIVGRYGNRIGQGKFTIDGIEYNVTRNNGGPNNDVNQLHGGLKGLHKRVWQAERVENGVALTYRSADGEEGYPGNLTIKVTYTLTNDNEMQISYQATTDKKTPVNLTSHTYFNLSGDMKRDIEGHILTIKSEQITPVDSLLIPTGEFMDVAETPFDFRLPTAIGARIRLADPQLKLGGGVDTEFGGYDHNWVFSDYDGSLKHQVRLYEPESGRYMDILTEEPGIQFYAGNFMDGTLKGKSGKLVKHRYGLALEPQHFPDGPNQPNFPNTLLGPGEVYETTSIYKFGVIQ